MTANYNKPESNYANLFVPQKGIYALSHSVGPLTLAAKKALDEHYLQPWQDLGGDAWPHWLAQIDDFCEQVALLINCEPSTVCPQSNLGSGFSAFLGALSKREKTEAHPHERNVVLMHRDAFASMGFVVQGLSKTYGLKLVLIESDPNDLDAWTQALEKNQVLACLFTHVHSNTSVKSDVKRLCELAHIFESFALVDIAQSAGIVEIDIEAWDADAVFGSCVKWLCGGPGAGFMQVKASLNRELAPDPVAWFSHKNPFEFDIEHFEFDDSARRFWGGTPSVAPYAMAAASINCMRCLGISNVVTHNHSLRQHLLNSLSANNQNRQLIDKLNQLGGSLCLEAQNAERTHKMLTENQVRFDERNTIFRISLHLTNTLEDAEIIASCFDV